MLVQRLLHFWVQREQTEAKRECVRGRLVAGEEINKDVTHKGKEVVRVTTSTDDKEEEYYDFSIKKSTLDSGVNALKEGVKALVTDLAPNLGIGAAAGKAASEVIKQTPGMAAVPRTGLVLLASSAAALGAGIGISAVEAVRKNSSVLENFQNYHFRGIDQDKGKQLSRQRPSRCGCQHWYQQVQGRHSCQKPYPCLGQQTSSMPCLTFYLCLKR